MGHSCWIKSSAILGLRPLSFLFAISGWFVGFYYPERLILCYPSKPMGLAPNLFNIHPRLLKSPHVPDIKISSYMPHQSQFNNIPLSAVASYNCCTVRLKILISWFSVPLPKRLRLMKCFKWWLLCCLVLWLAHLLSGLHSFFPQKWGVGDLVLICDDIGCYLLFVVFCGVIRGWFGFWNSLICSRLWLVGGMFSGSDFISDIMIVILVVKNL